MEKMNQFQKNNLRLAVFLSFALEERLEQLGGHSGRHSINPNYHIDQETLQYWMQDAAIREANERFDETKMQLLFENLQDYKPDQDWDLTAWTVVGMYNSSGEAFCCTVLAKGAEQAAREAAAQRDWNSDLILLGVFKGDRYLMQISDENRVGVWACDLQPEEGEEEEGQTI